MKLKKLCYIVPLVLAGAFNAHASTFTVGASGVGVGGLLTGSNSGSFNLNSVLSPVSAYPLPLNISSASVIFNFSDDTGNDPHSVVTQSVGSNTGAYYSTGSYYDGSNYIYSYNRNVTQFYASTQTEQGEAAQLYMGSGNALVGAGQTTSGFVGSSTNTVGTGTTFDYQTGSGGYTSYYSCGFFSTCSQWNPGTFYNYYSDNSNQTTTNIFSTTGIFSIVSNITSNTTLLNELMTTGMLPFQLNLSGDALLTGATLQVTAEPAPVPLPGAAWLLGSGLLGLLGVARRKTA